MDKHFYPERGEAAFPDGCPCCGELVREFFPASDDAYAMWKFACGSEMIDEDDVLYVNDDCPDAMAQHIEGIIVHRHEAA